MDTYLGHICWWHQSSQVQLNCVITSLLSESTDQNQWPTCCWIFFFNNSFINDFVAWLTSLKDKILNRGSALTFNCMASLMAIVESSSCRRKRRWAFDPFLMRFVLMWLLKWFPALHLCVFIFIFVLTIHHWSHNIWRKRFRRLGQFQKCDRSESRHASASMYYMGLLLLTYLLAMCNLSWWIHHIDQPQSKPMVLEWYCLYDHLLFHFVGVVEKSTQECYFPDQFTRRVYIFKRVIYECLQ